MRAPRRISPADIEELCRLHALPLTFQRRVILEALSVRSDHPTADQLFDSLRRRIPELSRTTVYRTLETFARVGVARKVCHPGAAARYELNTQRHHHLVCLSCEAIVDLKDTSLDGLPLPSGKFGFSVADYSIQFRGLCPDCASKPSTRRARQQSGSSRAGKTTVVTKSPRKNYEART